MTDPALDRYCPVHGHRSQDGYNSDLRCNAIVGYEVRIPLLCAEMTTERPKRKPTPEKLDKQFKRRLSNARREINKAVERAAKVDLRPGHYAEAIRLVKEAREEVVKLEEILARKHGESDD